MSTKFQRADAPQAAKNILRDCLLPLTAFRRVAAEENVVYIVEQLRQQGFLIVGFDKMPSKENVG